MRTRYLFFSRAYGRNVSLSYQGESTRTIACTENVRRAWWKTGMINVWDPRGLPSRPLRRVDLNQLVV
ncbi:hypothetical protein ACS0PU_011136 [Formica fusca]